MNEFQKQLDYAWAAGFIDGEGCIRIMDGKQKVSACGAINICYTPQLKVGMCHRESLERLQAIFGIGSVYLSHRASEKQNESYSWNVNGPAAIEVIRLILPYMTTKRTEAELALTMADLAWQRGRRMPLEIREKRREIFERLREMKAVTRFRKNTGF